MIAVGMDAGLSGAWAAIDVDRRELLAYDTLEPVNIGKTKARNLVDPNKLLARLSALGDRTSIVASLEAAYSFGNEGSATMFAYGASFGIQFATLSNVASRIHLVAPQSWQAAVLEVPSDEEVNRIMAALKAKDKQGLTKVKAVATAERAFPRVKLIPAGSRKYHTGLADAVCIAMYAAGMYKRGEPRLAKRDKPTAAPPLRPY